MTEKGRYLFHYKSDKGLKGTIVNQVCNGLNLYIFQITSVPLMCHCQAYIARHKHRFPIERNDNVYMHRITQHDILSSKVCP